MSVAQTIADQLGKPTLFMLGAQKFVGSENSLSFRIRGSRKVNYIQITLAPDDTYSVYFAKIGRAPNFKVSNEETLEGVYADMLHDVIEKQTGLATRMPRVSFGATEQAPTHHDIEGAEDPLGVGRAVEYLADPKGNTRSGLVGESTDTTLVVATIRGTGNVDYSDVWDVPRANVIQSWAW